MPEKARPYVFCFLRRQPDGLPAFYLAAGRPVRIKREGRNNMSEKALAVLNALLVETFNDILKVEEQAMRAATGGRLTINEVHVLDAVGLGAPRTISEIAASAMVTVSTMTITVNRLQKKALVERVRDGGDGRVVRVRLTPEGERIVRIHQDFHRRMAESVTERLEPDALDVLTRAMENLQAFFRSGEMGDAGWLVGKRQPEGGCGV